MTTLIEAPIDRNAPPAITLDELRAIRARMAVARVRLGELTPRGRRRARDEVRRAA
jgi:hypothetical protein